MSKMDDLRAMREARYEADRARAGRPATKPAAMQAAEQAAQQAAQQGAAPSAAADRAAAAPAPAETPAGSPVEGVCGHRAISGRTCTRERGHAAKSHRYS